MYDINNGEYKVSSTDDVYSFLLENVGVWMDNDEFDQFLDDTYDSIELFGSNYAPSEVYQKVDPVAYDIANTQYIKSVITDYINNLKSRGNVNIRNQYQIKYINDKLLA